MTRYVAYTDSRALAFQQDVTKPGARKALIRPTDYRSAAAGLPKDGNNVQHVEVHYFVAPNAPTAALYFRKIQNEGCTGDLTVLGDAEAVVGDPSKVWRSRGRQHNILARLADFGLGRHVEKKLAENPQLRQIDSLLGQLCDFYHKCPKEGGVAKVPPYQMGDVLKTLAKAEEEVALAGAILGSASDAMDAAYRAFGVEHHRSHSLVIGTPEPTTVVATISELPPEELPPPTDQSNQKRHHKHNTAPVGVK